MNLCKRCKSELEENTHLPIFSGVGATAGILGAALTGMPVLGLVPLFAGMLADAGRCRRCGTDMDREDTVEEGVYGDSHTMGPQTSTPHSQESIRRQSHGQDPTRVRTAATAKEPCISHNPHMLPSDAEKEGPSTPADRQRPNGHYPQEEHLDVSNQPPHCHPVSDDSSPTNHSNLSSTGLFDTLRLLDEQAEVSAEGHLDIVGFPDDLAHDDFDEDFDVRLETMPDILEMRLGGEEV